MKICSRYLLSFSYIGTRFSGIQKNTKNTDPNLCSSTIQGTIELALQKLRPLNPIVTHLSSRTDAGVHAFHSTLHVDLERYKEPFVPDKITFLLNKSFYLWNLPIRIIETRLVPREFHARYNAKSRTYLYRLAVLNNTENIDNYLCNNANVPIEEIDRCYFINKPNFDINIFKETAALFEGRHDFRTFMSTSRSVKEKNANFTLRRIQEINVRPGASISYCPGFIQSPQEYTYWNILIRGNSFLYKQVRRIIGSLVAVSQGRLTQKDIHEMLTIPSAFSWCSKAFVAPPYGLYLCNVEYCERDLNNFSENEFSGWNTGKEKQSHLN